MLRRNATWFAIMLLLTGSCPILADRFEEYLLDGVFELPDIKGLPAGVAVFDVSPATGRLVAVIGVDVYLETGVHSNEFVMLGELPGADIPLCAFCGPVFVRVSPDGDKIAVGNNGGETFTNFEVGVFALSDLSGGWFSANHFDGAWSDNTTLILTASDFVNPSIVTALDTTSDPAEPTNPTVIANLGGASAGIALDAAGNLYTGNGFDGTIKFFDRVSWSAALTSGVPLDFEADGIVVADVLSAAFLGFDLEGNLHVGGGDFGGGDTDYAALVRSSAIQDAIAGLGPADSNDPAEIRKLDPEPFFGFNFFDVRANTLTGRLYVREDLRIYVYASPFGSRALSFDPAPGQLVNNPSFNDPARALGAPVGGGTTAPNNTSVVSLGGFGGSITIAFDHTVLDDPANPMGLDAVVFGNAFWLGGDANQHWAECGHLEISRDDNRNGLADDAWFLIPGSHITDPIPQPTEQTWDHDTDDPRFPPSDPLWIPPGQRPEWTTEAYHLLPPEIFNALVIVNPNGPDAVEEGVFGYADFSPTLRLGDTDADNIVDDFEIPSSAFYVVPDDPMEVGITPGSGGGDAFDIAWAIDAATGEPAALDGFDFIRITTAVNFIAGALGEVSPEIDAVADIAPDCNGSGLADWYDIELGDSFDDNADGVPDECSCLVYGDVNGDGANDLDDLSCLLDGLSGIFDCPNVAGGELDISPCSGGDGDLNLRDLLAMLDTLAGASPCPSGCP